ncbi:MAG: hypothetical protein NWE89_06745 [Candidatus Bathyarchaeota archaeon]|nr:hypothetical protein [Candidatus Bathyarchaeota archaeon]
MILQVFHGLSIATWDPAYNSIIAKAVPENERGTFYGNLNGLKGFLGFPAPILGAYLFQRYGFTGTFSASIAMSMTALILALRLKENGD